MTDPIKKGYADTAAGQIHYRRVGGGRTPVVLLHRTPVASASFDSMLRIMAGERAAIALDTPGFGQSFCPSSAPGTIDYARWLLAALDALDVSEFHLCAHHTGTHFAAEMALLAPGRVRSLLLSGVMYTDVAHREKMRIEIGQAQRIDAEGRYLTGAWTIMRSLFPVYDAALVHAETIGALSSIEGRNQAFGAILGQDFPAVFARIDCPVKIVQPSDDPLGGMLVDLRAAHPDVPVERIGPAFLAAPERQPRSFAAAVLAFAAAHDPVPTISQGPLMTDRRFELTRTATGFDLGQVRSDTPAAGPGEVLIRVHAVSLNRRDIDIRSFAYPVQDVDHFVPLSDAAGEIAAVGAGVTAWKAGDRVCSTFFQNWTDGKISLPAIFSALGAGGRGVFADHIVLAETGVARIPDAWSYEEGASISCAGVTAWTALMRLGGLEPGDWVLVIGTGGVATFALQIAVAAGAKVAILSSSDEKLTRARDMGAELTINYNSRPDWDVVVREATGGAQQAVELGGTGTLEKTLACMGIGGHVALIGALAGFGGDISGIALIMSALRVSAVVVGSRSDHVALTDFLVEHGIRPVIDSVFEIDQAEAAYARAAAGAFGKVVIRLA
jgi:NADPH:quinone reductase-like Zn-dependent oxidoreductase/pimeloyl-ACP methyl ester carboxylesterase